MEDEERGGVAIFFLSLHVFFLRCVLIGERRCLWIEGGGI